MTDDELDDLLSQFEEMKAIHARQMEAARQFSVWSFVFGWVIGSMAMLFYAMGR